MLKGMNDNIKKMNRTEISRDAETQVGPGELFWNVAPQADEDNESAKAKPHSNCFYSLIKEGSHEPLQPKANEDKWSLTPTII